MAGSSQYYAFATGTGANLEALTDYAGDPVRSSGEQPGLAKSARANRVWRQSSVAAAGLAQFCANAGYTMNDDGDVNAFAAAVAGAVSGAQAGNQYVQKSGDTMTGPLTVPGLTNSTSRTAFGYDGSGVHYFKALGSTEPSGLGYGFTYSGSTITAHMWRTNGVVSVGINSAGQLQANAGLQVSGATSLQAVTATSLTASGVVAGSEFDLAGGGKLAGDGTGTTLVLSATGKSAYLSATGATGIQADPDGFVRLGSAIPRIANDSRAVRADWARGLGEFYSSQIVLTGNNTLTASQCGALLCATASGTQTLPGSALISGDVITIYQQSGTSTVVPLSGFILYDALAGSLPSVTVPAGSVFSAYQDSGYWKILRLGTTQPAANIQPISSYSASGNQADITWTANQWDEVLVQFDTAQANLVSGNSGVLRVFLLVNGTEVVTDTNSTGVGMIGGTAQVDGIVRLNVLKSSLVETKVQSSAYVGSRPATPASTTSQNAGTSLYDGTNRVTGIRFRATSGGSAQPLTNINISYNAR